VAFSERLAIIIDAQFKGAQALSRATEDTKKMGKSVVDVQNRWSKFARVGDVAIAGLAGGVALFGNRLLGNAAELEAWNTKVDTVFEDSADGVRRWADDLNERFGVTDDELAGLAASFGDLLKPMGFTADQAAGMSKDVVGLAGALSEWTGGQKSAAEVAEILGSAMTGEREALKSLGIVITEADIQQRLLEKGQQDLTGAALAQAEAIATQELIFERSADAQKAYAEGSNEALVAQNKLKATVAELQEKLAATVVWFTESETRMKLLGVAITALITGYAALKVAAISSAAASSVAWLAALGPIGLVIAAVATAAVAFYLFRDQIIGALSAAWGWIANNWPVLLAILTGPVGVAVLVIVRNFSRIRSVAASVVAAIGSFFRQLPGRIAGAIRTIPRIIGQAMARAASAVAGWVSDIVHAILSIPSRIAGVGGRITAAIRRGIGNIDLSPGFDIPGVPFLQHGAIVRKPTLAVIGEAGPEAVVPLGRSLSSISPLHASGGGFGGPVSVDVQLHISGSGGLAQMVQKAVRTGEIQLSANGARVQVR
jgi:hypothetical protein